MPNLVEVNYGRTPHHAHGTQRPDSGRPADEVHCRSAEEKLSF